MSDEDKATVSRKDMVSWGLNLLSALALMIGAWFFGNLTDKLDDLSTAVNALQVNVAVMAKNEDRIKKLEEKSEKIPLLEQRVKMLEEK